MQEKKFNSIRIFVILVMVVSLMLTVAGCAKSGSIAQKAINDEQGLATIAEPMPVYRNVRVEAAEFAEDQVGALLQEEKKKPFQIWPTEDFSPANLYARIENADDCSNLDLTGLDFDQRCMVLTAWRMEQKHNNIYYIGLVDLTSDGWPELFMQEDCTHYGMCEIYDISSDFAQLIFEFESGDSATSFFFYRAIIPIYDPYVAQGNTWSIFQVMLPDGTQGGMIETMGRWRVRDTFYFPLVQNGLDFSRYWVLKEGCDYGSTRAPSIYYELYENSSEERRELAEVEEKGEEKHERTAKWLGKYSYAIWKNWEDIYWPYEDIAADEFQISVKDKWLGSLLEAPWQPWPSPLVCNECEAETRKGGWHWVQETIQQLLADYDQAVAEYDPISPATSGAPG